MRLVGFLLIVGSGAVGFEFVRSSESSAGAVAIAAGLCGAGGVAALAVASRARGPRKAVTVILAGVVLRGVAPLVVGLALRARFAWLAAAHIEGWLLGFYLLTLIVEAWLLPRLLAAGETAAVGERTVGPPSA